MALNLLGVMKQNQPARKSIKQPPPPPPVVQVVKPDIDLNAIKKLILSQKQTDLSQAVRYLFCINQPQVHIQEQQFATKRAKVAELERLIASKVDDLQVLLKV